MALPYEIIRMLEEEPDEGSDSLLDRYMRGETNDFNAIIEAYKAPKLPPSAYSPQFRDLPYPQEEEAGRSTPMPSYEGPDIPDDLPGTTPEGDYAQQLFYDMLRQGTERKVPSQMPVIPPEIWDQELEGIRGRGEGYYVEDIADRSARREAEEAEGLFKPKGPTILRGGPGSDISPEEFAKRFDPSKIPSREEYARMHREAESPPREVRPHPEDYLGGLSDPEYQKDVEIYEGQLLRPYTTPEMRGGADIESYAEPLNQPGFIPRTSSNALDFAFQQEDYMAGNTPNTDLDKWPNTVEEFILKFGREPATDSEMEFYYPDEEAAR